MPRFWLCAGAALALHGAVTGLVWAGTEDRPAVVVKSMAVRTLSWVTQSSPPETAATASQTPEAVAGATTVNPAVPDSVRREASTPQISASSPALLSAGLPASAAAVVAAVSPPVRIAEAAPERQPELPPAPDYMKSAGLEVGPRPLGDIEPEYPETAHLQEGTVTVRILISETGHVDNVGVVKAEPRGLFEQAALEAFGKARFEPARYAGLPVKSQLTVEVHFLPINRGARISGRGY